MKRKLIACFLAAFAINLIITAQPETYFVAPAGFNSQKYDEFSPTYYGNGLVFCSNRRQSLVSNYLTPENKGLFKIFYVDTGVAAGTARPRIFSKSLETKFNDGPATFSGKGDTIYFSRNIRVNGPVSEISNPRNKLGVFSAVNDGGNWVKITDLRFNNEYYNITTPCISPDGKRLFFASDNPDGHGGSDLYFCEWRGDFWDEPVNMGSEINTAGNESYPYVNSEGALYFSSDGLPGSGGKDIFYTKQSGGKWLSPIHIDAPINSKFDDFGLVADPLMNTGYFSSKRDGTIDIYSFETNIHQLFYCNREKINQYRFKFTDEGKIPVDERYIDLVWDFGDGLRETGPDVVHSFSGPGKYNIRLDATDKKSGEVFFTKLSFTLELKNFEQPLVISPASVMTGTPVNFDGLSSNFPGSDILAYTWYFGDGGRFRGEKVAHTYREKGDYEVRMGLKVRNPVTGVVKDACVLKPIRVFSDKAEKAAFDKKAVEPVPVVNVFDYDAANIQNLYSCEREYNQDMVFQVEVLASKAKLMPDNKAFASIPVKYSVREIYRADKNVYSYVIDEEQSLMATWLALNEIRSLGYKTAAVRTFTVEDPAAKELNNLKKVFGVSADILFRRNDNSLTVAGTQLLDLVMGFMAKYPSVTLEIANHTDNIGSEASNLVISQKRSEAMVNYLVTNGVSRARLLARGFGESRPISSNYLEADRKLNRRVDFRILKQ